MCAGYAGDVWPQQPAPSNHPWRHMPNHALTPHVSGTTLDAQVPHSHSLPSTSMHDDKAPKIVPDLFLFQNKAAYSMQARLEELARTLQQLQELTNEKLPYHPLPVRGL
jgi:hypothetical protein